MQQNITVIAEHAGGRLRPITWEMIGFARRVQAVDPAPIEAVILGEEVGSLAHEIAQRTGVKVLAVEVPGLRHFQGEAYTTILADVLATRQPAITIAGHTSQGWEFAPRLAMRLGTSCITGVTGLRVAEGRISYLHPVHGGKFLAETASLTDGALVTIQPGVFREPEMASLQAGSVEQLCRPLPCSGTELVGIQAAVEQDAGVTEAEVIVAAGKGIGKEENLALIHELARLFPRSAVGGSRPLCDQGWLRYAQQIGLTGATVSPRLYIACGISGAYQHVAGMRDSGFIVAINKDAHAAILEWADVGIIEDLERLIPLVIEAASKKEV